MTPRQRRLRRRTRRRARPWLILLTGVLVAIGIVVVAGGLAVSSIVKRLPNLSDLKPIALGQNSRIYDRDGAPLGVIAGDTNRTVVRYPQIPTSLVNATVAIEDKRFWTHHGVDWYRIAGALVRDLSSGSASQGGSTITMQLVKNLYGSQSSRTFEQKIEEAHLALQVEKKYTKKQILARYLNGVFYGNNAIGVEAASLTYFNRHVKDITLPQAALLAGLPQAPTTYNPFVNPVEARQRRNDVLEQMAQQGYITEARAQRAERWVWPCSTATATPSRASTSATSSTTSARS